MPLAVTDSNYPLPSHDLVIKVHGIHNRAGDLNDLDSTELNHQYWLVHVSEPTVNELESTGGLFGYYAHLLSNAIQMDLLESQNRIYLISDRDCAGFCVYLDEKDAMTLDKSPGVFDVMYDIYWDKKDIDHDKICRKDQENLFIFNERDEHLHDG